MHKITHRRTGTETIQKGTLTSTQEKRIAIHIYRQFLDNRSAIIPRLRIIQQQGQWLQTKQHTRLQQQFYSSYNTLEEHQLVQKL